MSKNDSNYHTDAIKSLFKKITGTQVFNACNLKRFLCKTLSDTIGGYLAKRYNQLQAINQHSTKLNINIYWKNVFSAVEGTIKHLNRCFGSTKNTDSIADQLLSLKKTDKKTLKANMNRCQTIVLDLTEQIKNIINSICDENLKNIDDKTSFTTAKCLTPLDKTCGEKKSLFFYLQLYDLFSHTYDLLKKYTTAAENKKSITYIKNDPTKKDFEEALKTYLNNRTESHGFFHHQPPAPDTSISYNKKAP